MATGSSGPKNHGVDQDANTKRTMVAGHSTLPVQSILEIQEFWIILSHTATLIHLIEHFAPIGALCWQKHCHEWDTISTYEGSSVESPCTPAIHSLTAAPLKNNPPIPMVLMGSGWWRYAAEINSPMWMWMDVLDQVFFCNINTGRIHQTWTSVTTRPIFCNVIFVLNRNSTSCAIPRFPPVAIPQRSCLCASNICLSAKTNPLSADQFTNLRYQYK